MGIKIPALPPAVQVAVRVPGDNTWECTVLWDVLHRCGRDYPPEWTAAAGLP